MIKLTLTANGQTIEASYGKLADVSHDEIATLLELSNTVGQFYSTMRTSTDEPKGEPASSAQKKYLRDLGIPFADNITKAEAKALLSGKLDK